MIDGPWGDALSLLLPCKKSSVVPGGLVEPDGNVSLPVLPEVGVGHDVVVFDHGIYMVINSTIFVLFALMGLIDWQGLRSQFF